MTTVPEAAKILLGAVERQAMEILDLPAGERESRYKTVWAAHFASALELGLGQDQATEMADKMDEFIRALVRIIESGGGGAGGVA